MPVVLSPNPRSASCPALVAANAPATPARPNAPIAVCDRLYGAALRGKTNEVYKILNEVKMSNANIPRMRKILSSTNNKRTECNNLR